MTRQEVVASALYLASKVENTARKPNEIAAACLHVNVPVIDRRVAEDEVILLTKIMTRYLSNHD